MFDHLYCKYRLYIHFNKRIGYSSIVDLAYAQRFSEIIQTWTIEIDNFYHAKNYLEYEKKY